MKISKIFLLFLILPVLFACKPSQKNVVKVNGATVTTQEFKDRMSEASYYYNKEFLNSEQGKNQILDGIVKETVMLEIAKKKGYDKKDDYKTKFKNFEKQALITDLIKDLRDKELKVTDEDIKKEFDKNKSYYDAPTEIKVAHILVNKKEEAEKILKELQTGTDFAVLASSNSLDTSSSKNGGELEWFGKGDMVPEFEVAAFSIKDNGAISGIIKTNFGYHIIKKIDDRTAKALTFDAVKVKLGKILEKQKFDNWFEKEKKGMKVKINEKLLKDLNTDTVPAVANTK
jgi:parvulin-like peptidyl-prolyl isomerase